jgi:regulatory protein YycI of two-component signal transduction system YycFG
MQSKEKKQIFFIILCFNFNFFLSSLFLNKKCADVLRFLKKKTIIKWERNAIEKFLESHF